MINAKFLHSFLRHTGAVIILISLTLCVHGQQKINDGTITPTAINKDAIIEFQTINKGVLMPRIALTSIMSSSPLQAFTAGMYVYNTATAGALPNDVTPGMYYSDGVKWIRLSSGNSGNYWSLNGNAGTDPSINFIGTTDNNPLIIKTQNAERVRITENGWVGIGTSTPQAALQIKGQLIIDTITAGNKITDSLLVANPTNGRVKMISAASFMSGVQQKFTTSASAGQTIFTTPFTITDVNKITLYRNGVLISFTVNDATSIISEIACVAGDEIRIIQLQ